MDFLLGLDKLSLSKYKKSTFRKMASFRSLQNQDSSHVCYVKILHGKKVNNILCNFILWNLDQYPGYQMKIILISHLSQKIVTKT
jgi:hypothetical protein